MQHITHRSPDPVVTTEPLFSPTPDTRVSMSCAELPARVSLLHRSEERHGLLLVILVFNARLTPPGRAEVLRRSESLPADLIDQIVEEILERGRDAADHVSADQYHIEADLNLAQNGHRMPPHKGDEEAGR